MNNVNLRHLFAQPGIIRLAAAHDALGAKLVQRAGFEAVWSGGLEISTSHGVPDANILSMAEFLDAGEALAGAVDIPVVADCDTGFGNSNNVIHMVRRFEACGIAAVCIEDKVFPKVNSFVVGRQELVPIPEFTGKIRAAKHTQQSSDFMVIARVEALIAGLGQEEALKRAHAYADAGADAILIHSSSTSPAEIFEFAAKWDFSAPLVVVPTTYNQVTAAELEDAGIKMVIYANHGIRASIHAISEVFDEIIRTGSSASVEGRIAPLSVIFDLQGMSAMKEAEAAFLRTGETPTQAIIVPADEQRAGSVSSIEPISMLDVAGKPLLQRQAEVLGRCGVSDIQGVGGLETGLIDVPGVKITTLADEADDVDWTLAAASGYGGRTLMVSSNVLFEVEVVKQLLQSGEDVTLLVAAASAHESAATPALASVGAGGANTVAATTRADGEVFGMALFTEKGIEWLRDARAALTAVNGKQPVSIDRLLRQLSDSGHPAMRVSAGGWVEIQSADDRRQALELLAS